MITSLAWIPQGMARRQPVRFELSQDEYRRIKQMQRYEFIITIIILIIIMLLIIIILLP